jgi:hypothetical protein
VKRKNSAFYCFSPPVMMATFLIESALLLYVLVRYKMSAPTRVTAALLAFLATFQLAEYYVCTGPMNSAIFWSRLGFVAITMLPALGLHLVHLIAGKKERTAVYAAYTTCAAFLLLFSTSDWAFTGYTCRDNYVIFDLRQEVSYLYGLYYYGWLFNAILASLYFARQADKKRREALYFLIAGYLVFLVPTITANMLRPVRGSIPSIMCGFAVFYAFILTFGILPAVHAKPKVDVRHK